MIAARKTSISVYFDDDNDKAAECTSCILQVLQAFYPHSHIRQRAVLRAATNLLFLSECDEEERNQVEREKDICAGRIEP